MKRDLYLFYKWSSIGLLLLLPFLVQAQVFVKADASGSNDGTSWENAYTKVSTAMENSEAASDLWIAAGNYVPTTDPTDSSAVFFMDKALNLYGGFAGTESALSERDILSNKTVLNGDISGDDVKDDFVTNRSDNLIRVLWIDSSFVAPVILDGLTINGGHALNDADVEFDLQTGAGVYSFNALTIDNCTFTGNSAYRAGGVYVTRNGDNTEVTNSTFSNNFAGNRSSSLYLNGALNATVRSCLFKDNTNIRAALYLNFCEDAMIDDCDFISNANSGSFGGAVYNWNSLGTKMKNCFFNDNTAANGGALYIDGRSSAGSVMAIDSCTFDDNRTTSRGGAIRMAGATVELTNSTFTDNFSDGGGAGYASSGAPDIVLTIDNCTFTGNSSSNRAGSFWFIDYTSSVKNSTFGGNEAAGFAGNLRFSGLGNAVVDNCEFGNNTSERGGGAISWLFGMKGSVTNCLFDKNTADAGGGIFVQGDSTFIDVEDCLFTGNTSVAGSGGAITMLEGVIASIDKSSFESNSSAGGAGGAISVSEDSLNLLSLDIHNSIFSLNSAEGQAGALNVGNGEVNIVNSVFVENFADNDDNPVTGRGGAISNNASVYLNSTAPEEGKSISDTSRITMTNCLLFENDGSLAGGIAQWEYADDTLKGNAYLILQNTIFMYSDFVSAPHYAIEQGAPVVISKGGNVTYAVDDDGNNIDDTLNEYLTQSTDQKDVDPQMIDPVDGNYRPMEGSPLINAGVAEGAPTVAIDGTPRDAMPDIGPYEFILVSSRDLVDNTALTLAPNPVHTITTLSLDNDWTGQLQALIVDATGKTLQSFQLQKTNGLLTHTLDLSKYPAGMYQLVISSQEEVIVKGMLKQ